VKHAPVRQQPHGSAIARSRWHRRCALVVRTDDRPGVHERVLEGNVRTAENPAQALLLPGSTLRSIPSDAARRDRWSGRRRRRPALSGISMAACLVILVFAPAVTVVGYEMRGYRHQAEALLN